jgi:hypothetical protein
MFQKWSLSPLSVFDVVSVITAHHIYTQSKLSAAPAHTAEGTMGRVR